MCYLIVVFLYVASPFSFAPLKIFPLPFNILILMCLSMDLFAFLLLGFHWTLGMCNVLNQVWKIYSCYLLVFFFSPSVHFPLPPLTRVLEKKTSDSVSDQLLWWATARQPQQVGWIHTNGFFWTMSPPLFVCVCVCVWEREREREMPVWF